MASSSLKPRKTGAAGLNIGRNVIVIGAGNTAIDCATIAKRLGAERVTMVYRRTDREMTCYEHEYDFARKEGIEFRFLTQPARVLMGGGQPVGLECLRVELGAPDASGRPAPMPIVDSEFVLHADQIVKAIGQQEAFAGETSWPGDKEGLHRRRRRLSNQRSRRLCHWRLHSRIWRCFNRDGRSGWQARRGGNPSKARNPLDGSRGKLTMADLRINFAGIKSPNPFWLASAPPTNSGAQIHKAFEAGWGGAVWKTIGAPVLNVSNRYGAWHYGRQRMLAINNVELISDRPIEINLREIAEVKRAWPDRAVIVSAMVESKPEAWRDIVRLIEDTGADGIELNYGCPHGMSERGMGAAVGQVPEYCEQITRWVMESATIPVIMKLTPNITNIVLPARAGVAAGANALSLINTINSIVGVDLDTLELTPSIGGKGGHGGYAGPAVKPIALNMLAALGTDEVVSKSGLPISGMGGIATWQDAAQFLLLGASSLQVCTAVMHYGFRIIEDLCDGLTNWMDEKGFKTIAEVCGHSLHRVSDFKNFDLSFRAVARIDTAKCIKCDLCYVACNDTAHQCIDSGLACRARWLSRAVTMCAPTAKIRPSKLAPSPWFAKTIASAAGFVTTSVRLTIALRWSSFPPDEVKLHGASYPRTRPEVTEDWETMKAYRERVGIHIH